MDTSACTPAAYHTTAKPYMLAPSEHAPLTTFQYRGHQRTYRGYKEYQLPHDHDSSRCRSKPLLAASQKVVQYSHNLVESGGAEDAAVNRLTKAEIPLQSSCAVRQRQLLRRATESDSQATGISTQGFTRHSQRPSHRPSRDARGTTTRIPATRCPSVRRSIGSGCANHPIAARQCDRFLRHLQRSCTQTHQL